MVMVLLPTDGIPIIDLDKDIVEYPVQPTKDDLMSLTKSVLQEMVQSAGFQGSLSKLTKSELSKMCMEKWDLISKSYAVNMCSIALTQQDVDSAVLKLNEASIFTPYTCLIKMDGVTRFQYFFATSTRFGEVFVALQLRGIDVGSPISGCQWIIKNGHSSAYPHEFLTEWGSDGATFYLVAHQSGGVVHRGVRTSIKKDDIIARVVKKSKETILRKVDRSLLLSVETPIPEAFAQILTQIEAKVITYHSKMVRGELNMKDMLSTLNDEQIVYLKKVFEYKTSETTEQKIVEAVDIIYPDAVSLDMVIPHIKKTKMSIIFFSLNFIAGSATLKEERTSTTTTQASWLCSPKSKIIVKVSRQWLRQELKLQLFHVPKAVAFCPDRCQYNPATSLKQKPNFLLYTIGKNIN